MAFRVLNLFGTFERNGSLKFVFAGNIYDLNKGADRLISLSSSGFLV